MVIFLTLFFVYIGLWTQAGILNTAVLWTAFVFILICAVAGKFGGSALVSKALGKTWTDSLSIGALVNTRGLMVLMALLTTMMTSPVLDLINKRKGPFETS